MCFRRLMGIGFLFAMMMVPSTARADGLIIPFFGVNFGGDSGENLSTASDAERWDWGVSFAWMSGGVIGLEGDFGYTPDYFGKTDVGGSKALSLTGNVLVGVPFGGQKGFGVRPYGVAGAGLIHTNSDAFQGVVGLDNSEAVWDAGGGVLIFFGPVGIRGDVRYFRSFTELDLGVLNQRHVNYTRGSAGFIFRF